VSELEQQQNESEVGEKEAVTGSVASTGQRMIFILVAALVIILDHLTKLYIENWLPLNHTWAPFPELAEYFRITHVSNTGAAFGLFPEGSLLFALIAMVVGAVIIVYNYRLPSGHLLLRVALGLQLGGALGNLVDRLRLGHVTDFLDFGPWPVFNVADMAIVAGVILLGFLMIQEEREMRQAAKAKRDTASSDEQTQLPTSLRRSNLPPNHEQRTT
jgi:signal peptidase II